MTHPTAPAAEPSIDGRAPEAHALDEATLRRVFPDAPASLAVPSGASSLLKERLLGFGGEYATVIRLALLATAASALALGVLASSTAGWVIAASTVMLTVGIVFWQHSEALDDFFDRYSRARGLRHAEGIDVPACVPLLRRGDERRFGRVLDGTIAGHAARLALYTYTEVSHDSEGDRSETDYDFTVLQFRLPQPVAARFAGVYCSPRGLSLGALQDRLAHDRKVELESSEFHRRYSLRVVDQQDDIALYELFSPPFVHRLATELHVHWEQCGEDLVVWRRGHECDAADLDRFCLEAWHVLHRYLEEWQ